MHWLYNYKVYFQDGMTVQRHEHAIYFVKRVEQILDTPWIVCIHVVDVCEQEDRKIFSRSMNPCLPLYSLALSP